MQAKVKTSDEVPELSVKKQDLVNAWLVLEKLVVSMDRIGSAYAADSGGPAGEERLKQMYYEVGRFVAEKVFEEANQFRVLLSRYLTDDEAEALSDEVGYWRPQPE